MLRETTVLTARCVVLGAARVRSVFLSLRVFLSLQVEKAKQLVCDP